MNPDEDSGLEIESLAVIYIRGCFLKIDYYNSYKIVMFKKIHTTGNEVVASLISTVNINKSQI